MPDNKAQFESLHKAHYAMVHQMCLGFLKGDISLAKDLTQEVFINAWGAMQQFKGESSHKTWLYRVTVNTCLKFIRDKKGTKQVPFEEIQQLAEPENISNDAENQHQSLYRAIGQLAELDRLIIMMILDELEYEEIAKVIGISEGNLRVKIHRIKKNIKKILENE